MSAANACTGPLHGTQRRSAVDDSPLHACPARIAQDARLGFLHQLNALRVTRRFPRCDRVRTQLHLIATANKRANRMRSKHARKK